MRIFQIFLVIGMLAATGTAYAEDKATPEDVYRLVVNAYDVVKALKEEALPAFNNPKGEFVYKDTYVFVMKCPEYMAAHPFALDKLKDRDLRKDYPFQTTLCEGGESPFGNWVEYYWPKPGSSEPSRKISFTIRVTGTPYTVVAGIYNDDLSLDGLNNSLRKK